MPNGRPTRRLSPRLARGFTLLIVPLLAGTGCQRLPLRFNETVPESTSKITTLVGPASTETSTPVETKPKADVPTSKPVSPPASDMPAPDPLPTLTPAPDPTPSQDAAAKPSATITPEPDAPQSNATAKIDDLLVKASATATDESPGETPKELMSDQGEKTVDTPLEIPDISKTPEPVKTVADTQPKVPPVAPLEKVSDSKAGEIVDTLVAAGGAGAPENATKESPATDAVPANEPESITANSAVKKSSADVPEEMMKAEEPAPPSIAEKPVVPPEPAAAPVVAVDDWQDNLLKVREVARKRAGEPGDAARAWAIRARVLDWLAGDGPQPTAQNDRVWNSVLATLSAATGPETPDDSALSFQLATAVEALESFAPLQITALNFCRKIDGFGHYETLDAPAVRAGQPLLVYCEMAGLRYENGDGTFHSRLASSVEVVPSSGGRAVWSESLGTAEDVCRRRRRDYFVNYRLVVPASLAPGSYTLRLAQTDLVSERSVTSEIPFSVKP